MATDTFTAFTACSELGLAPGASEREAKAAWRRLVSQWHPDRNPGPGAVGRMQRLNQALEALRRAGFPGHSGPAQPSKPPAQPAAADPPAGGAGSDTSGASGPTGQPGPTGPTGPTGEPGQPGTAGTAGRSLRRQVRLTLGEAALGCTRVLTGKGSRGCATCTGAGWLRAGGDCATCHGAGALRQPGWFGLFGHASACAACGGSGFARLPCLPCAGTGQRSQPGYRVSVRLPAGVRDGDLLTVAAHRMPQAGQVGDLQIRVRVQPHPLLMLDDDGTVRCSLAVSGWAWMANRTVQVPGLGGPLALPLDRTLRCHRLVGAGFPVSRGGPRGDLLVSVLPQFPAQLSTDQHILIDQLVASGVSAG